MNCSDHSTQKHRWSCPMMKHHANSYLEEGFVLTSYPCFTLLPCFEEFIEPTLALCTDSRLAIETGQASDLVAIDFSTQAIHEKWEVELGPLPPGSPTAVKSEGGVTIFFSYPKGFRLKTFYKQDIEICFFGDDGKVQVPPAWGPREYVKWKNNEPLRRKDLRPLPYAWAKFWSDHHDS